MSDEKTKPVLVSVDKQVYEKFTKVLEYLNRNESLKKFSRMKIVSEILTNGLEAFIRKNN